MPNKRFRIRIRQHIAKAWRERRSVRRLMLFWGHYSFYAAVTGATWLSLNAIFGSR